jgi:hypothetical protein
MSPFGSFVLNLKEMDPELGAFHGGKTCRCDARDRRVTSTRNDDQTNMRYKT